MARIDGGRPVCDSMSWRAAAEAGPGGAPSGQCVTWQSPVTRTTPLLGPLSASPSPFALTSLLFSAVTTGRMGVGLSIVVHLMVWANFAMIWGFTFSGPA